MATINGVDFSKVVDESIDAVKAVVTDNWDEVEEIVKNVGENMVNDVAFIAKKKALGEFNEEDARVFLEDQKMLARIRLRSVAIITLQIAERIWNAIVSVFQTAIHNALGWKLL